MAFQVFQCHRGGYEDLDKCNQSSSSAASSSSSDNDDENSNIAHDDDASSIKSDINEVKQQQQQAYDKNLTASKTALHLTPQINSTTKSSSRNSSTLSLSKSISIGSICLTGRSQSRMSNAISLADELVDNNNDTTNLLSTNYFKRNHHHRVGKENIWFICYVMLYAIYLAIGGICFCFIETPIEQNIRAYLQGLRNNFLTKYPQVLDDDLETFLSAIIAANDRGISPLRNASNEMNWSFGQALFFSSTVVTTIGYGRVTPLSQTGKIFCIIYAAIGIPLTLVLLSAVVERLLIPTNWLLGTLNSKLGHLYQPFNIRLLHLSVIVLIVSILFFAIPTAIFAWLEPAWGALDAFYYCFISLTTIGLGDYIPGEGVSSDNRSLYKILITAYLLLGLIAMMFVLTIFYDIPQLNLGQLFTESANGETEKLRTKTTTCYSGGPSGLYMPQRDEDTTRVVRIRPHGHGDDDESPSPSDIAPPTQLNP